MSSLIQQSRAKLKLALLAKGTKIKHVSVKEIPEVWGEFGTKGDKWIKVNFPEDENACGCVYVGKEDSVFDPHIHKDSVEHLTIINPGGEMEVITDTEVTTVKYPNSIVIGKDVPHAVVFKKETRVLILWHPRFKNGWTADFIDE